jgi:hypothetical protein
VLALFANELDMLRLDNILGQLVKLLLRFAFHCPQIVNRFCALIFLQIVIAP